MEKAYQLVTAEGTGSALVEAMLAYKQVSFELLPVNYEDVVQGKAKITQLNPLSELPILILPSGKVMTESAAIALYLDEVHSQSPVLGLPMQHPERADYLKWLIFLVAAIYPTSTYGDLPSEWLKTPSAFSELTDSTDSHRKSLWLQMENQAGPGPYWFGEHFTAIDIYLHVMSHWRPRQTWFQEQTPRLWQMIQNTAAHPILKPIWTRNFTS